MVWCSRSAIFIVLFVASLSGQTANLYGGYSFLSNDLHIDKVISDTFGEYVSNGRGNLNGWNLSGEIKVVRWIGLVADFNGSYGSVPIVLQGGNLPPPVPPTSINTNFYTYLFGPRLSVQVGNIRPFAEALVGVASQNLHLIVRDFGEVDTEHDRKLATAFGGGLNYRVIGPLAWRVEADYVASRLFKAVPPGFPLVSEPVQHNVRVSTGIVIRF